MFRFPALACYLFLTGLVPFLAHCLSNSFSTVKSFMSEDLDNLWVLRTHTQLFYGHFSRTTRVSRCQKKSSSGLCGAREDNRGRHADNPAGRHSIRTSQWSNSIIPPFLCHMPFLLQPFQFILAWDRHQICWITYPVAWLIYESYKACKSHFAIYVIVLCPLVCCLHYHRIREFLCEKFAVIIDEMIRCTWLGMLS